MDQRRDATVGGMSDTSNMRSTMTPLEELQAAHKRLSELRNRTGGNRWKAGRSDPGEGWFYVENADTGEDELYTERGTNVDLIVTLHRTIDAQLETLSVAGALLAFVDNNSGRTWLGGVVGRQVRAATDLARAINGGIDAR